MSALRQRRPGVTSGSRDPEVVTAERRLAVVPDQPDDRERLHAALAGVELDDEVERAIRKLDREALAGTVADWLDAVRRLAPAPAHVSLATRRHLEPPPERSQGDGPLEVARALGKGKRIVLFVPEGTDRPRWFNMCTRAAERARGAIVGVAATWLAAEQMLAHGEADAVMVAVHEHLPRGRVLVGSEVPEPQPADTPARSRRPVLVRRGGDAW